MAEVPPAPVRIGRRWIRGLQARRNLVGLAFFLPAIVVFLLAKYYPLIRVAYMSFFDYNFTEPPGRFMGVANYAYAFSNSLFWKAFFNNWIMWALGLVFGFFTPMVQALLLSEVRLGKKVWSFLYLLPVLVPGIVMLLIHRAILQDDGLINQILALAGLGRVGWLTDPRIAKIGLNILGLLGGGLYVFVILAAIEGVAVELHEAAVIDGANVWQRVRHISLPAVKPVMWVLFINSLGGAMENFLHPYLMTGGGPDNSTLTMGMLMYNEAFILFRMGQAAAYATIMLACAILLSTVGIYLRKAKIDLN
ncbi:MAG: carbohydrate ABC transporter permease [Bacteroidota bacterium]